MLEISIVMIEFDDLILIEIEVDMQRTWIIYSPPTRERKREKERVEGIDEIEEARKMLPGIPAGVFSSVNEFTTPL